jgi:hypothetical protein
MGIKKKQNSKIYLNCILLKDIISHDGNNITRLFIPVQ